MLILPDSSHAAAAIRVTVRHTRSARDAYARTAVCISPAPPAIVRHRRHASCLVSPISRAPAVLNAPFSRIETSTAWRRHLASSVRACAMPPRRNSAARLNGASL